MQDELVQLRRQIHREPEIGLSLPRTQEKVLGCLDGLPGVTATPGAELDSVVAVLRGGRAKGRRVLLRADMDALPVHEQTGLDFAADSEVMHACGHDLHTTMLVGAARLLSAQRERLAGDVVFMFQPGEEGYNGAGRMIDEGVLDAAGGPLDAAYAMHVTSAIFPGRVVSTRPGPFMAAADVLHVQVRGTGGHASAPHHAQDPVPIAAEIVTGLQTLVTRQFDIFDPVVITVGSFHAGTQHNIISDRADFEATVRSFSAEAQRAVSERAVRLCRDIAAAHGLRAEVEWETLYPVTTNNEVEAAFFAETAADVLGAESSVPMRFPLAGAEDFSRVLNQVPGAMAFLGACPPELDPASAPFNHSAYAMFDEGVLSSGAALYAELALRRLGRRAAEHGIDRDDLTTPEGLVA
jgi:hippurate hydrolase